MFCITPDSITLASILSFDELFAFKRTQLLNFKVIFGITFFFLRVILNLAEKKIFKNKLEYDCQEKEKSEKMYLAFLLLRKREV